MITFREDEFLFPFVTDREAVEKETDHQPHSEPIPPSPGTLRELQK
jgi:hypothetical protein